MAAKKERSPSSRWIACPTEEEFFGNDRKSHKAERKRMSAKDRSKFKKTDRTKYEEGVKQQLKERVSDTPLCLGRVLSITSQTVLVDSEGNLFQCQLRGLLKKEKMRLKGLVVVGDFVSFSPISQQEGVIVGVEPRYSFLSRADNLSRQKEQLIAANLDQVIITASVMAPSLKPSLIDRYIIAARKGNMAPLVVINKVDLLDDPSFPLEIREKERELLLECVEAYKKVEIPLLLLSAVRGEGISALKKMMIGYSSVFSGQSGTGKSSLINQTVGLHLPVGGMVRHTKKGAHTTTCAHLVPLEEGGFCIDTPGVKSFGVWDLFPDEVEAYFSEIHSVGEQCKFPDCSHSHEGGCAVIQAVEKKEISSLRYASYLSLRDVVGREHLKR